MHQTRQETSTLLPISRKGTKYIARALSDSSDSVPVVIAVRDMLKLAKTAKEVKEMIKDTQLKINGKIVRDYRESIRLFNILEAGKVYQLTLLPTGKYTFEETKSKERLCKVVGKKILSAGKIQFNMHDGSNLISNDKIAIGDSVYIDSDGKLKSHISFAKGKKAIIISGKYLGHSCSIKDLAEKTAIVSLDNKEESELKLSQIALI